MTAPWSLQTKSLGRPSAGRIGVVLASVGSLSLRLSLNPKTVLLNSKRVRSENSVTPWIADGLNLWCWHALFRFLWKTLNPSRGSSLRVLLTPASASTTCRINVSLEFFGNDVFNYCLFLGKMLLSRKKYLVKYWRISF